ncbi:PREDICTED: glycine N-acyltransferase-like protein 3 [Crocodylus porosus]|uniref:glycine N-acyltransferase-like protein 3 n=1 Tax=Crocodylus porosus TaxID=8502 RepID=UPI000939900E|nr:PREDICTED: glycine N-acyltransferase-like protein 3 [Crocodylus porosus]
MLLLSCSSKLLLLEGALRRGLPETLPVYGAVMHINRGNPAGHEVLVDSWPEFKVVLSRPRREVVPDPGDYYTNLQAAFCQEDGAWQALLETTDAVDWSRAFQLQSFQNGVYEAIRDMAKAKDIHLDLFQYVMLLHPDPPAMPHFRLEEGLTLAPVPPSHAALLNNVWDFGGNLRSLRYLEMLTRCFPSACLLGPDGHPVSWSLTDPLACLSHGYTLPAYRGQHYQGTVLGALVGQLHAQGFPAFCGVLPENKPSLGALHRLGFCSQPGVLYMMVLKPDPTAAPGH